MLAGVGDADLLAHVEKGAGGAVGAGAGADVFAEGDEEAVDVEPVAAGEFFFEGDHCFFGGLGGDVAPAIGYAVDVGVYADVGAVAGDAEG